MDAPAFVAWFVSIPVTMPGRMWSLLLSSHCCKLRGYKGPAGLAHAASLAPAAMCRVVPD